MAVYTTIDDPEKYFQTKTYTGSEGTDTISLDSDVMQPDMIWIKDKGTTAGHTLQDSVRGWNAANKLAPYSPSEEQDTDGATWGNYGYVSAVAESSFTVIEGANTPSQVNDGSDTYVAWCWKESATAGFDIVSFTGNDTARTISHSLSAVPNMMILKDRDAGNDWFIYHSGNTSAPQTDYIKLNSTNATADLNTLWNDTAPTSSVFTIGTNGNINTTGNDYIAYLFTEKQGFSKFGSYTGNGSTDGAFIYTGFRPAQVILKATNTAQGWFMVDSKRSPFNPCDGSLHPNATAAEDTSSDFFIDLNSNGFKLRDSDAQLNGSYTYMYMAFAEAPFVNSNGVPCNAR